MQSMRQLEHQWNRKYQYPWVFFNDEPFSAEFKVRDVGCWGLTRTDMGLGRYSELNIGKVLL